jgi:hypothetical protein
MGNTSPQINSTRSGTTTTTTKTDASQCPPLKKSRSLREYTRNTSLINSSTNNSSRKTISLSKPSSTAPTDAEIIDVCALRCALPVPDMPPADGISTSNINNEGENQLMKQLDYIHSCVRKDKGLFGKYILPRSRKIIYIIINI